jgi:hypothetical protein
MYTLGMVRLLMLTHFPCSHISHDSLETASCQLGSVFTTSLNIPLKHITIIFIGLISAAHASNPVSFRFVVRVRHADWGYGTIFEIYRAARGQNPVV